MANADNSHVDHRGSRGSTIAALVFIGLILAFLAYVFVVSWSWPFGARVFPQIASAIGFATGSVAVIIIGVRLLQGRGSIERAVRDGESWGHVLRFGGWVVAFSVVVYLLGFRVGFPLLVFAYSMIEGGRLIKAGLAALVVVAYFEIVMVRLLSVTLLRGVFL